MEPQTLTLGYDYGPLLAGAASGLLLSVLLRIPAVAVTVAMALAGALCWAILGEPEGPTALFEAAATRMTELAASGFLTGMLVSKAAASVVQGLVNGAKGGRSR